MREFRVIEIATESVNPDGITVKAISPEKAAEIALGVKLTRSGKPSDLRARVYCQTVDQTKTMYRLYAFVGDLVD